MPTVRLLIALLTLFFVPNAIAEIECGKYRLTGEIVELRKGQITFRALDLETNSLDLILKTDPTQEVRLYGLRNRRSEVTVVVTKPGNPGKGTLLDIIGLLPIRIGTKPAELTKLLAKTGCEK